MSPINRRARKSENKSQVVVYVTAAVGLLGTLLSILIPASIAHFQQVRDRKEAQRENRQKLMVDLCNDTEAYLYVTGRMLDSLNAARHPENIPKNQTVAQYNQLYFDLLKMQSTLRSPIADLAQIDALYPVSSRVRSKANNLQQALFQFEHDDSVGGPAANHTKCDEALREVTTAIASEL